MAIISFSPDLYHHTFGAHHPAINIDAGDTIITTTLDAHGFDAEGKAVAGRSNPLSGPVAINGAQIGDTLAIHIRRLTITRSWGFSYRDLRPNVVPSAWASKLPPHEEMRWNIDLSGNTASPENAPLALPALAIPLYPMLGCIGVAPERGQFITSYSCGNFGGNIDSPCISVNTMLYLPVLVEGALLFVGDGHASQSHGELAGTGIEVPMEIEIKVDIIQGKSIHYPRGENERQRFTLGIDKPLEHAMQHAIAEMLMWLQEDAGLTMDEACLFLGQAARFELANVINPVYSIACLIDKWLLKSS